MRWNDTGLSFCHSSVQFIALTSASLTVMEDALKISVCIYPSSSHCYVKNFQMLPWNLFKYEFSKYLDGEIPDAPGDIFKSPQAH